jgi:flagellin
MSLGVLNNLSAVYAENNLNSTNNSLSKTLQQLSSGSRINSGADDAAGLSLVDGLTANQTALTQSETNATEGAGLLQVADGALTQVTSLLNRAVTLATEASNGTLNSSQDTAANQEYQSILSEINNIGSTTTYNSNTVFGSKTNIYTGDSSQAGSSVDALNIRSLSSTSVGDSGGVMSYSNGASNVFIDLSSAGKNAAVTDSLGAANATTTINVNYLTQGANGSVVNSTANIAVGAGTSYANNVQGLISAINGAGLGLSATFGTATQAGTAAVSGAGAADTAGGGGTDTGIVIAGVGIGTGTNSAGEVGALTIGSSADTLSSGTFTVTGASGVSHNLTLGLANSTDTLANLASTINAGGYGVTASVNSSYLNGNAPNTVLTLTSANSAVTVAGTNLLDSAGAGDLTLTGVPSVQGTGFTNTIGTITSTNANAAYTAGSLKIGSNAAITLGGAGANNAANLAATINAGNYGVTASLDSTGKILTFKSANAADTFSANATITGGGSSTINAANQNQLGVFSFGAGSIAGDDTTGTALTIDGVAYNGGAAVSLTTLAANITNSGVVTATLSNTSGVESMTVVANGAAAHGDVMAGSVVDVTNTQTVTAASVQDTPAVASSNYYSMEISGSVADTSIVGGGTLNTAMTSNTSGTGGVATMSYSDVAGQSLASTDLTSQADAESALTSLNAAITDVAAQDGYIGAQINTLNSVSNVLSTQGENLESAQNAVQATDYAAASSNMSKYEILSQTGISALAQANSVQQEVTKLLQ